MPASSEQGRRPVALVTGASSGIGLELARLLAGGGHDLVLVSRSLDRLRELAGEFERTYSIRAEAAAHDLSDPSAAGKLHEDMKHRNIQVEILVNNAGFGTFGHLVETDPNDLLEMMQLNMVGLTLLARLFGADMAVRRRGRILNVASTAAFQPGPLMAVYYASKAYVLSLSEAMANELKDKGVTVTALCPGPVATKFAERANTGNTRLFNTKLVKVMDAESVARSGYRGLMAGKPVVIPGVANWMTAISARVSPHAILLPLVRYLQDNR